MTARRPLPWVVGGSLAVLLAVALVTWAVMRSDTYTAEPPGTAAGHRADPVAAAQALAGLQRAVIDGDRGAAQALAADPASRILLGQVIDNAVALRVTGFTVRYVDESGGIDTDGHWQAAVDMAWRFDGFDAAPVREEVQVALQDLPGTGRVAIAGFGGGADRTPLWLTGPLQVRRSDRSLVLAESASEAQLLGRRADIAVTVVRRVLPHWRGHLVVEVPGSEEQLDQLLGAAPDTYTDIAAVSASVDGTLTLTSVVHIFVNPSLYDSLDPVGGQVVLSHEATHVATGAPVTVGPPLWLLEGFADYVALRDVTLPISTTAGQIIAQVRRDGPPDHLPDSTDFDEHATHLGASYEAAWLACRVLADAGGQDALVRFYERVSRGDPLEEELSREFGLTQGQLLARWQQRLRQLANPAAG